MLVMEDGGICDCERCQRDQLRKLQKIWTRNCGLTYILEKNPKWRFSEASGKHSCKFDKESNLEKKPCMDEKRFNSQS